MQKAAKAVSAAPGKTAEQVAVGTWLSVVRAYSQCDQLMARRLEALGVKTAEHEILANLQREPGVAQQTLAQRCFTAKSHISALLAVMEKKGWVRRETNLADARAKRLFLTAAGERMAAKTAVVQAGLVAGMCEAESAQSLLEVKAAMQRVGARLQKMLDEGG